MTAAKRKPGKPTGGQPKIVRLNPEIFCCCLGPRFRAKGARVQCVGKRGHSGLCRSSEFSSWDRRNPMVWVAVHHEVEPRGREPLARKTVLCGPKAVE